MSVELAPSQVSAPPDAGFLLAIQLRNVQRYIAESVTTRDLNASSRVSSELARTICSNLEQAGAEVVSPNGYNEGGSSFPNRVVAVCRGDVGAIARAAIASATAVWHGWGAGAGITIDHLSAPEMTWCAVPLAGRSESDAMADLTVALAGRKRLNQFVAAPDTWSSATPEFDICPVTGREPSMSTPAGALWKNEKAAGCSVWVKRLAFAENTADDQVSFPSTATIAVAAWVEEVSQRVESTVVQRYVDALDRLPRAFGSSRGRVRTVRLRTAERGASELAGREGRWLLTDALSVKAIVEQFGLPEDDIAETAERTAATVEFKEARKLLVSTAIEAKIGRPTTYLALVALDGDGIGKRLGSLTDFAAYKSVSRKLAQTAQSHRALEENFLCRVVYSGGDDLFALCSGRDAIPLAVEARNGLVNDLSQELPGVTASAGVLWMHYMSPLQTAVRQVQKLVAETKALDPLKDRIGLAVYRRGGLRAETSFRFEKGPKQFSELVGSFESEELSPSVIGDLQTNLHTYDLSTNHLTSLIQYLLNRHSAGMSDEATRKERAEVLTKALSELTDDRFGTPKFRDANLARPSRDSASKIIELLTAARFLASEAPSYRLGGTP